MKRYDIKFLLLLLLLFLSAYTHTQKVEIINHLFMIYYLINIYLFWFYELNGALMN